MDISHWRRIIWKFINNQFFNDFLFLENYDPGETYDAGKALELSDDEDFYKECELILKDLEAASDIDFSDGNIEENNILPLPLIRIREGGDKFSLKEEDILGRRQEEEHHLLKTELIEKMITPESK